jgi:Pretoxin HINT domain
MPTNSAAQQDLTFLVNSYAQPQQQPLFRPVTAADLTPEARERAMRTTGPRTWADVTQSFRADQQVRVPVGSINAEAQRVAASAQDQLNRDVASLEAANRNIASSNAFITAVLKAATGASLPPEPEPWQKWLVDQLGYRLSLTTSDDKPTVVEDVPLDVTPQPIPVTTATNLATFSNAFISRHSCFGKGTIVRTLDGSSSIETLRVGDIVLSQDILTGKLDYRPVLKVHHNPPCATFRVSLGDDAIVTSPSHRFWVAGRGWVMARDLKVGDPIRTVGDVTRVTTIEPEKVQPVFNLDIADDADFFVGSVGALVHDNTLPDLRLAPFDATSVTAVK